MRPLLTAAEARALDRAAQARGIGAEQLMERAGESVARTAVDLAGGRYGRRAVIVCGKGNNGGDGLVAARVLAREGLRVTVVLLGPGDELREPAATNYRRLTEVDVRVRELSSATLTHELDRGDVAIDAVFGTGFRGVPEDAFGEAIHTLNEGAVPVVAVDIPSGVHGDTGVVEGEAVWADATVTFGAEKPGLLLYPGAAHAGSIQVADIGFPVDLLTSAVGIIEPDDVALALPVREPDAHKRSSGVVLVVAGSRDMTGAPRLVAAAASRIGAGLVQVAAPASAMPPIQSGLLEATFVHLSETEEGSIAPAALDELKDRIEGADAVAIGPGLGRNPDTAEFARRLVQACPVPLVIDADCLNAFEGRADELAGRVSDAVLTPHLGEASRLLGVPARDIAGDRIRHARDLAASTRAIALLKGSRTVIASPDATARISDTGGAFLATGGTGDVLTGAIAGLLAGGCSALDAAGAAAFVHGIAGRLAGSVAGDGTTAGDVATLLPEARLEVIGR